MNQDPHHLVTRTELWLQWAAEHGVRYDDTGKSFPEVARDYYQTSDSYRELVYPDLGDDALTASHRAAYIPVTSPRWPAPGRSRSSTTRTLARTGPIPSRSAMEHQ